MDEQLKEELRAIVREEIKAALADVFSDEEYIMDFEGEVDDIEIDEDDESSEDEDDEDEQVEESADVDGVKIVYHLDTTGNAISDKKIWNGILRLLDNADITDWDYVTDIRNGDEVEVVVRVKTQANADELMSEIDEVVPEEIVIAKNSYPMSEVAEESADDDKKYYVIRLGFDRANDGSVRNMRNYKSFIRSLMEDEEYDIVMDTEGSDEETFNLNIKVDENAFAEIENGPDYKKMADFAEVEEIDE